MTPCQEVSIPAVGAQQSFKFKAFEGIFTERSVKYSRGDVKNIASAAGLDVVEGLTDSNGMFLDSIWRVPGAE